MSIRPDFFLYLAVMAGVTYLIRMIPLALVHKRIENRFVLSFLYYVPYAVLSAMVVPAIFTATDSPVSAVAGFNVYFYIINKHFYTSLKVKELKSKALKYLSPIRKIVIYGVCLRALDKRGGKPLLVYGDCRACVCLICGYKT